MVNYMFTGPSPVLGGLGIGPVPGAVGEGRNQARVGRWGTSPGPLCLSSTETSMLGRLFQSH